MDLFNAIIDQHRNWLPHEGTVNYYGRLLSKEPADFYLNRLLETIEWRNDEAIIFGRNGLPRVGRAGTDPIDDHAAFTELYDRVPGIPCHTRAPCWTTGTMPWMWYRTCSLPFGNRTRHQALKVVARGRRKDEFASELTAAFNRFHQAADSGNALRELTEWRIAKSRGFPAVQEVFRKSRKEGLSHRHIAEKLLANIRIPMLYVLEKPFPFISC